MNSNHHVTDFDVTRAQAGTEYADNRRGYLFWNLPVPRSVQLKCFRRDRTFLLIENSQHVPEGYVAYPLGDRWLEIDDVGV